MNYDTLLTMITLFFLLLSARAMTRYRKKYNRCQKTCSRLSADNEHLLEQCRKLQERITQNDSFSENLSRAEQKTKFQSPSIDNQPASTTNPPERYRYIQRLSENGMGSRQIADILMISIEETEQLLTLSQLCRHE